MVRRIQNENTRFGGFTLLELLVVFVIISLLITLTPPLFKEALPTLTLKGAAEELLLELRYLRSQAIAMNKDVAIKLFPKETYYIVGEGREKHFLPNNVQLIVRDDETNPAFADSQTIAFFPDGSSNGGNITLRRESRAYSLTIDWLTGQIDIQELDNNDS